MNAFHGVSALNAGMVGATPSPTATTGLESWEDSSRQHTETWDAMEIYFDCITTCSLEDGECVTRCVEQLRETA